MHEAQSFPAMGVGASDLRSFSPVGRAHIETASLNSDPRVHRFPGARPTALRG